MKVKKAIKKIVALGVGATMLGATLFGAAAQLEDFPGQYVDSDGEFDGLFVVGEEAAAADIIGVNAITAAVQSKALKRTFVELPASEASFSAEDGEFLIKGNQELLALNGSDSPTPQEFDEDEFSVLLAEGTVVEDDDDDEFDYTQKVTFTDIEVKFDTAFDSDRDEDDPVPYLSWGSGAAFTYTLEIDEINLSTLEDNEEIEILGDTYTFKSGIENGDDIILYRSSESRTLEVGEQIEVGDSVVELIAIDTDKTRATISVDGKTHTYDDGEQKTLGGLALKVDEVIAHTIGDEFGFVKVFIGADELELQFNGDVELNGEEIEGVVYGQLSGDNEEYTGFNLTFSPDDFEVDDDDSMAVEDLFVGESFVEPLFNNLKYEFVKAGADADDTLKFNGGSDEIEFEFVNQDGEDASVYLYQVNSSNNGTEAYDDKYTVHSSVFTEDTANLENLEKDHVFIISEDTGDDDEVTSFYKINKLDDDDDEVEIENMNSGEKKTFETGDEIWNTEVYVGGVNATDVNLTTTSAGGTIADGLNYVITEGELKVTFTADNATVTEETFGKYDMTDLVTLSTVVSFGVDSDEDTTVKGDGDFVTGDNDMKYLMSQAGTTGTYEADDHRYVEFTTYNRIVEYNVLFGPAGAEASQEEGANGYYITEVVSIPASASVLDTEVTNPMSENLIVVGGPCANSVASTLMGNPADCAADFTPGTALIKMFDETDGMASGKVALLVAGYDAEDTRAAAAVVSELGDELEGTEVVLTTSTSTVTETETVVEVEDTEDETEEDLTE